MIDLRPAVFALALSWGTATPLPALAQEAPQPTFEQRFEAARQLAIGGQRAQAIAAYSALLLESPDNSDVLLGRGRVHAWEQRWPEAEADLRAATTRAPRYADAWSALGDMYLWSDRPAEAVTAYTRWIELEPDKPAPYLTRARAHRAAGDRAAAQVDLAAAATHGAPVEEVAALQASLQPPRVQNPLAVAPEGYRWAVGLSASTTDFSPDRGHWSENGLTVRRYFEQGSLALESLGARRFGADDRAWALDAYVDVWPRAYANLRYQHAPDAALFPRRSMRAELYQGVGDGWELAVSYDRLDFAERTEIFGLGLGYYVGNYYLRLRSTHIPDADGSSVGHRALARWYYAGNADDYLELSAGTGRSTENLNDLDRVRRSDSRSVGLVWTRYLTPYWGFRLGGDIAHDSVNVGTAYDERSVSASLYRRW